MDNDHAQIIIKVFNSENIASETRHSDLKDAIELVAEEMRKTEENLTLEIRISREDSSQQSSKD